MIDHKHKCIFIHIPKTAGVSIRTCFNQPTDKFMHVKPDFPEYKKYWKEYFTFTFVRNPWDRFVSAWMFHIYRRPQELNSNFLEFVKDFDNEMFKNESFRPQLEWIKDLDFIGKVENIQSDMEKIFEKIGMKKQVIPRINKTKHRRYAEYYSREAIEKVYSLYAKEINQFEYKFSR